MEILNCLQEKDFKLPRQSSKPNNSLLIKSGAIWSGHFEMPVAKQQ